MTLQPNDPATPTPAQNGGTSGSTHPADSHPSRPAPADRAVSCIDALELALLHPGWKPFRKLTAPRRRP